MLRGIIAHQNRIPKFILHLISFIPVALTALYLAFVITVVLPVAVALCIVLGPLLYVIWRAKQTGSNSLFGRILYPFELLGLTIVNSPAIVTQIVESSKKIKRPALPNITKANRSKAMLLLIRVLAILGILGVAVYLVMVAAVVVPLAIGFCVVAAPLCYLIWYVKEKKFIPLFHKIPTYLEQFGFTIVNSRKIMTKLMVGMKMFKWPMF